MKRRALLVLLVLGLAVPLVWLLRDFVRQTLIVRLWPVFWGFRTLFESVPQLPLWGLFLLIVAGLATRSLMQRQSAFSGPDQPRVLHEGRIRVMTRWIEHASQGTYFRWSLVQHLSGLAWEVMAFRDRTEPDQVRQRLASGRLDLPPLVACYLQSSTEPAFVPRFGLLARVRAYFQGEGIEPWPDPALEAMVHFLEKQVQIESQSEGERDQ